MHFQNFCTTEKKFFFVLLSVKVALQQLPTSVHLSVTFFHVDADADVVDVDADAEVVDADARVWKKNSGKLFLG